MSRARVLLVNGSPRPGGNTQGLLQSALEGVAQAGAQGELINLCGYSLGPCLGCERCRRDQACTQLDDDMQLLYPKIEAARGLILGSPTHNYNLTAWMKAFIDRLYCFYDFSDDRPRAYSSRLADAPRFAAVLAVCEQPDEKDLGVTLPALELPLPPLGYTLCGRLAAVGFFDAGAVKGDAGLMARARDLGRDLAQRVLESEA